VTVREIASPVRNAIVGGPFGSDLISKDYVGDGVPVVRGQNMGSRFVSGVFAFVTQQKARSLEANLARPRDLVFTQRGTLGQVSLVPTQPYKCYLVSQSQMKVTVDRKTADPQFYYYVFGSERQQDLLRQNAIQTGVPHINLEILRALPVQRPALLEQEAISKTLGNIDALIECLERVVTKTRLINQGVKHHLLTGKTRLPGFETTPGYTPSELGSIPMEWQVHKLGDGVTLVSGQHVLARYCNTMGDGVAYLTGPSDFPDGVIHHTKYTTRPGTMCATADILVTVKGSGSGTMVISDGAYCISRQLMALRVTRWSSRFTYFSLTRDVALFEAAATGLIPGLSREDILNKQMAIPPTKAEQDAIARALSDMEAEVASLEARLAKTRLLRQGVMQQLLTGRIRLI
jgi:type I restriction enzyme S subunit